MNHELTIALVGNPNCGKTSLFNALTGLNQKVSNFPGTTIDKKTGTTRLGSSTKARIIDLPGAYSLYPKSGDEQVTYDLLSDKQGPDVVLFIADAANLKRNLLLFTQVADLGFPMVLALNMIDIAERRGIFYDLHILSEKLGVPVIPINARQKKGLAEVRQALLASKHPLPHSYLPLNNTNAQLLEKLSAISEKRNAYATLQAAINQVMLQEKDAAPYNTLFEAHAFHPKKFREEEILQRYHFIDDVVRSSRREKTITVAASLTRKLDLILTHRISGIFLFLTILFLIFQAIFSWSSYPMQWVEAGFSWLSASVKQTLPEGVLNDLLVNGVIAGLSGVLVFLPQIIVLFTFIALLEDVGYMARVGFIMDRIMRPFGMNGKSIVPLISGMACAVPSIMASRSIENKKEKLITILVLPLMSCSARLPVYTLLIGMLIPAGDSWGPFNKQGVILMAMYVLGFVAALVSALFYKVFIKAPKRNYFVMELPGYKLPVPRNILITLYDKGKAFVWGAGKIIVAVSVILWALASFGPGDTLQTIDAHYAVKLADSTQHTNPAALIAMRDAEKLQHSYAGEFGKWIEPVIRPLGFDWKIGIALLTSLAAREVFVGTLNTIYSVGGDVANLDDIRNFMKKEINPVTGEPVFSVATVLSLLVFYAFALQCMSTVSVVRSETGSWKWTLIQFAYMTALAYLGSLLVFYLFN